MRNVLRCIYMGEIPTFANRFEKWTWKTVGWAFLCFLLIASVNGLFSYLFDVLLFEIQIGYVYFYFSIIFFTIILYFFYTKFKVNWFGTFTFGLCGLIGIPIELWLEYYANPVLKSPWGAVGWGAIYIAYGLVADLSMMLTKLLKNETKAVVLSAVIFSSIAILLTLIPLSWFYVPEPVASKSFLTYWYFLIPYGIIQGAIGAYAGMKLASN